MKTAKKMRLAHYWDATFLTQIVPSYYFTVTYINVKFFFSPTAKQIARGSKRGRICQGYRLYDGGMEVQRPFHSMETLGTVCGTGRAHLGQRACPTWARCLPIS